MDDGNTTAGGRSGAHQQVPSSHDAAERLTISGTTLTASHRSQTNPAWESGDPAIPHADSAAHTQLFPTIMIRMQYIFILAVHVICYFFIHLYDCP
jgi:hypothetical protein